MFEANEKVVNPLIEPNSVKDTAGNIASVIAYLQIAEAGISEVFEPSDAAITGRGLILSCVQQAAESIANK